VFVATCTPNTALFLSGSTLMSELLVFTASGSSFAASTARSRAITSCRLRFDSSTLSLRMLLGADRLYAVLGIEPVRLNMGGDVGEDTVDGVRRRQGGGGVWRCRYRLECAR
jgi:hypothetical protein